MTGRLDAAVAARGLARSRTQAAQLIEAGLVSVDGAPVVKPSVKVSDAQVITVAPQTICRLPSWQAGVFDPEDPVGRQPPEPQQLNPPKRPTYTDPAPAPIHQPPLSYPDSELRLRSVFCD